jgi:hypothetical protein
MFHNSLIINGKKYSKIFCDIPNNPYLCVLNVKNMNRFDFLKALGISGAGLVVASNLNIGENLSESEQEKFIKLKNELVELIKTNKVQVEFMKGGAELSNISDIELNENEYVSENGYVFSPKGIMYTMKNEIQYKIINKKITPELKNEINLILEECLQYYKDFKWYRWQLDELTFTIARCYMLLGNFEEGKIWYGKVTEGTSGWEKQLEIIETDLKRFKVKIDDIVFTRENENLQIQMKPIGLKITNNNQKIIEGITKYKKLLKKEPYFNKELDKWVTL